MNVKWTVRLVAVLGLLANFFTIGADQFPIAEATANQGQQLRPYILKTGRPLVLVCNVSTTTPVYWLLNNETVVVADGNHYEITHNGARLIIRNPIESILGDYTCKQNDTKPNDYLSFFHVIGEPLPQISGSTSVVEGETLRLVCSVPPDYGAQITWEFGNSTYSTSRNRVKLAKDEENGIENAILIVKDVNTNDTGTVACHVRFDNLLIAGNLTRSVTIAVIKDKPAALWPSYLGISVGVLCTLYGIYVLFKRKQNKNEPDELVTDQRPDTKPAPNNVAEVRPDKSAL